MVCCFQLGIGLRGLVGVVNKNLPFAQKRGRSNFTKPRLKMASKGKPAKPPDFSFVVIKNSVASQLPRPPFYLHQNERTPRRTHSGGDPRSQEAATSTAFRPAQWSGSPRFFRLGRRCSTGVTLAGDRTFGFGGAVGQFQRWARGKRWPHVAIHDHVALGHGGWGGGRRRCQ